MAKRKSVTAQFAIVKGVLEPEDAQNDDAADLDEYQKAIRAAMDERHDATAHDLTLELNNIETQLTEARRAKTALEAKKEAIHRLISRYLQANNLTKFGANGFNYTETFKPVAKVTDKAALVDHCLSHDLKALLSVHSGTLNSWVSEAILQAIEQTINNPEELPAELQALGVEPGDNRGKENLGTEGAKEAFLRLLESVLPPGVVANARTALSRTKA